ncbi:MAG: hypothetical protein KGY70_18670 [Bacteroidales bacterium]|nr:hypothetical protein [Bacteroidales bacterium]
MEDIREKIAKYIHDENWSGWMEYLFSKCYPATGQFDKNTGELIIPKWAVDRWMKQMRIPYEQLSEREKESDRKEADRILQIINKKVKVEINDKEIYKIIENQKNKKKQRL